MSPDSLTINDIYTRKVGGEQFEYEVQYSTGKRVHWKARVYQHGELKGSPEGTLLDNHLTGDALRQSIVTLVEIAIEASQGIAE